MSNNFNLNLKVGNDNGNSEHDIIINGCLICQPNVFAKVKQLPNLDELDINNFIENLENNLIASINSKACSPSMYYIGEYARKSREMLYNMEVGLANKKYESDVPIVNTLGQIAAYAVKEAHAKNKLNSQIVVHIDMTTALPVTQYSKNNAAVFTNKFIGGKHNVIVHLPQNLSANVDIYFDFVKVIPESVPVVFYLQNYELLESQLKTKTKKSFTLFDNFIKKYSLQGINGSYFKNKKILHIAIGEGTTELPITNDIQFNPQFIKGCNNGIGAAIEASMDSFMDAAYLRNYSRQDFSTVLRTPSHRYYAIAMDKIEGPLEYESEAIQRHAKSELEKAKNDVDIIIVHGGGSILMRKYLEPKLDELGKFTGIKVFYVPAEYAVTLEAKGMYAFTLSEIFLKLKKIYNESKGISTEVAASKSDE